MDRNYNANEQEKILACPLHRAQLTGGLGPTPNSNGMYSTFSSPCNGCKIGEAEQEKGIWMSGFGVELRAGGGAVPAQPEPAKPEEAKVETDAEEKVRNCPLHRNHDKPYMLCHTPNSMGMYSTYAPNCNGCRIGIVGQ